MPSTTSSPPPNDPIATYRVQLHFGFTLDDAAKVVPYLARLGVSHVYTSPILQAVLGSTHGYDVVNHSRINPELGGAGAHARFVEALRAHGLRHLLDIVPNHMATELPHNRWWWDVLEKGEDSLYVAYFDLWDIPGDNDQEGIVLAVLGDHLRHVLESKEVRLERDEAAFSFRYHDQAWPVAPHTLAPLLSEAAAWSGSRQLARLVRSLTNDRQAGATPHARPGDRRSVSWQSKLAAILREDGRAAAAVDHALDGINADSEALGSLLDRQYYRMAHWTIVRERLGYRRFFDVHTLIGLRVENPRVFADTHRLILGLVAQGMVDGLRIDHIDGLRDPTGYLQRLARASPGLWIVVEKILEPDERLRRSWPVDGTTGYDFLNQLGALFVDPSGERALSEFYAALTGETRTYEEVVGEKKLLVLQEVLGADVERLADLLVNIALHHRLDFVRKEIAEALQEIVERFPVYRTYVHPARGRVHREDIKYIAKAVTSAKEHRPDLPPTLFDFLSDLLLLNLRGAAEADFVLRFQQLTGPAMAKGVEDTTFYCFNRLVSLNEVGGNPGQFGTSFQDFHRACSDRQQRWPLSMLATSTHDTKRGEDVRARVSILSEIPDVWSDAVLRWSRLNEPYRTAGGPDRNIEYLLYQTLVGAWPISRERLWVYMEKAAREAKTHTSWTSPNAEYEGALKAFVEGLLSNDAFVTDLEDFLKLLVPAARISSLSQTLIKMTAPGVPDIYQGIELWDMSLVDPDNRRPVDFSLRARLLARLDGATPERVLEGMEEGLPKLWVIKKALEVRRRFPNSFGAKGSYRPVPTRGRRSAHVIAFQRGDDVLAVAPRLVLSLSGGWADTAVRLPTGAWRNELTSQEWSGVVKGAALLRRFPVALLTRAKAVV